ncbi:MAG TPA: tetratricopeptide repeat protein, partial [Gemmatimonadales bacterium]|nr:tetratricopeptide repeat protein [Gemmatimonadales bacterium]
MAYTSEIDKLEQRYRENPKGRNFAPLADAYRKAGLLDNAIELCKSGLERHPDYVSAHIVYGRCLIDQKSDAAAADVFRKVITLDPENVLALRMLAEIAQRGSRFDEAVEWLTRLLSADPMNGEAAEALSRMRSKAAQTAAKRAEPSAHKVEPVRTAPSPTSPPSPASAPWPPPSAPSPPSPPSPPPPPAPLRPAAASPPVPAPEFVVEHASEEPVAREPTAPTPPAGDIEVFDGTLDFDAAAHGTAKAEGLEVQEEVELKPQDLLVEGLAHTQFESVLAAPPEPEQDLPAVDLPLIMPEEVVET